VWLISLSLSQALINKKLHTWQRNSILVLVGCVFYLLLFRGRAWSSGWIPSMVSVATILFLLSPKKTTFIGGFCFLLLMVFQNKVEDFIMTGDNEYSLITRLEAWKIILEIVKVNPVLGLGPANYRFYTSLYPIFGYYVPFNSHNNYMDIIAQIGFLGLLIYLWLFSEIGRVGWKLKSTIPEGFSRAYVFGALGGLAGTIVAGMLGDWVIPFVYNVGFNGFRASVLGWLFLGGLVALEAIYKGQNSTAVANR